MFVPRRSARIAELKEKRFAEWLKTLRTLDNPEYNWAGKNSSWYR